MSSDFELHGRTALVTGSSRGIGRAIALALAGAGADVAIHAASESPKAREAVDAVRAIGRRSVLVPADLSDAVAPRKIVDMAKSALGDLDILVCNASLQIPEPWLQVDAEHFDRQININLRSTFELMQLVAPAMSAAHWGRIVTIGSVQERKPHPDMPVYAATKCAQTSLTRSLAGQLAPSGVTVNNVAPGVIETDRNADRLSDEAYRKLVLGKIPLGYAGMPEDCAGVVLLLCSQAGRYITGQNIYVDGGMSL